MAGDEDELRQRQACAKGLEDLRLQARPWGVDDGDERARLGMLARRLSTDGGLVHGAAAADAAVHIVAGLGHPNAAVRTALQLLVADSRGPDPDVAARARLDLADAVARVEAAGRRAHLWLGLHTQGNGDDDGGRAAPTMTTPTATYIYIYGRRL